VETVPNQGKYTLFEQADAADYPYISVHLQGMDTRLTSALRKGKMARKKSGSLTQLHRSLTRWLSDSHFTTLPLKSITILTCNTEFGESKIWSYSRLNRI